MVEDAIPSQFATTLCYLASRQCPCQCATSAFNCSTSRSSGAVEGGLRGSRDSSAREDSTPKSNGESRVGDGVHLGVHGWCLHSPAAGMQIPGLDWTSGGGGGRCDWMWVVVPGQ